MTSERNDPLRSDPRPGDRVLRLHIDGVLDLIIPDGVDEEGHGWDGWRDAAIQSALDDGRWLDAPPWPSPRLGCSATEAG